MNKEKIVAKKAEIANYERILAEYGSGRWMDMGRRHLAALKEELRVLEEQDQAQGSSLDAAPAAD